MGEQAPGLSPTTLSYKEAAQYLGIGERSLRRLVASGTVRHVPIGHRVLFRQIDLDAYLDSAARGGTRRRA